MVCNQCKAEIQREAKFCTSCGAPLGAVCPHCGIMNLPDDKFCAACGTALATARSEQVPSSEMLESTMTPLADVPQYTVQEIEELLSLRKSAKIEESASVGLSQADIDRLFE